MRILDFLHNYQPGPVAVHIGNINIYWYGVLIVTGVLAAYFVCVKLSKTIKSGVGLPILSHIQNMGFYLVIFGLIGARLYHVLSEFPYYLKNPAEILYIWQGGLGIFGAVGAGVIVIFVYAKKHNFPFWSLADLLAPGLILAQAIGRWGNYFNSELFGRPTDLSWGIPIALARRPAEFLSYAHFHPAFLYESLWSLLVFVILLLVFKNNYRSSTSIVGGRVFAFYLIFYSFGRFIIEFLRVDPQPILLGLRLAQIAAMVVFICGLVLLVKKIKSPALALG